MRVILNNCSVGSWSKPKERDDLQSGAANWVNDQDDWRPQQTTAWYWYLNAQD